MNFSFTHEVHSNVFSTKVKFTEFGVGIADGSNDANMSAKQEQALFEDLGYPKFNIGDLIFKGKATVNGDKRVIVAPATEEEDGSSDANVSFIVNSKVYEVGPNFVAEYSVNAEDIPLSEVEDAETGSLVTKKLVAEAKCALFDMIVGDKIKEVVAAVKEERTRFETDTVETLTV